MNTTIRGHNFRVMVVMALIAVLVLSTMALVYALRPVPTTSHGDATPAHRAMSADGARGSTSPKIPTSSATPKWFNAWAMEAFAKASGEGERQMNQTAGEKRKEGGTRCTPGGASSWRGASGATGYLLSPKIGEKGVRRGRH